MTAIIGDHFALTTCLLKDTFKKARNKEPVNGEYLNFVNNGQPTVLFYSIEDSFDGNTYLVINFNAESQKFLLSHRELTFGTRTYLVCGCGKKCNALYLKIDYFACRTCQGLHYRSNTVNAKTDLGIILRREEKRIKLMDMREEMSRIIYQAFSEILEASRPFGNV